MPHPVRHHARLYVSLIIFYEIDFDFLKLFHENKCVFTNFYKLLKPVFFLFLS